MSMRQLRLKCQHSQAIQWKPRFQWFSAQKQEAISWVVTNQKALKEIRMQTAGIRCFWGLCLTLFSRHKNRSTAISSSYRKLSAALEIRPISFGAVSCTNSKRNLKILMSVFFFFYFSLYFFIYKQNKPLCHSHFCDKMGNYTTNLRHKDAGAGSTKIHFVESLLSEVSFAKVQQWQGWSNLGIHLLLL